MAMIRRIPLLLISAVAFLIVALLTSMEFSGSYAWFVTEAVYDDSDGAMQIPKMGNVKLSDELTPDFIVNDSDVPIILRARVIIESFGTNGAIPDGMTDGEYLDLVQDGNGWTKVQGDDGGIFLIYGSLKEPGKPTFDDYNIILPTPSNKEIPMPLSGSDVSFIFEALQATQQAYDYAWKGDYMP